MAQLTRRLLIGGTLLAGAGAFAQDADRYREWGREAVERVRADLDRAARDVNYLSEEDARRFRHVREAIGDFQRDWERGHFDREALHEVTRDLERVIEGNRLQPRDRDLLRDDAARLHRIGERYEGRGEPERGDDRVRIVRAFWGAGDRGRDVTRIIQDRVREGHLRMIASNQEIGFDAAPNVVKTLTIVYEFRGRTQEAHIRENDRVDIP